MKCYWSRLLLILVVVIGFGVPQVAPGGLSGDYSQDTLAVVNTIKLALRCQKILPLKHRLRQKRVKELMTLRRYGGILLSAQFLHTMRTALNSLAGHYSSYPNRPCGKAQATLGTGVQAGGGGAEGALTS